MKKFLSMLTAFGCITPLTTSVVACGWETQEKNMDLGAYELTSKNRQDPEQFQQWVEAQRTKIGHTFDAKHYTSFVVSKDSKWLNSSINDKQSPFVILETMLNSEILSGMKAKVVFLQTTILVRDIWQPVFKTLPGADDYTDATKTKLNSEAIKKLVDQDTKTNGWNNTIFNAFEENRFRGQMNLTFQIFYNEKTA